MGWRPPRLLFQPSRRALRRPPRALPTLPAPITATLMILLLSTPTTLPLCAHNKPHIRQRWIVFFVFLVHEWIVLADNHKGRRPQSCRPRTHLLSSRLRRRAKARGRGRSLRCQRATEARPEGQALRRVEKVLDDLRARAGRHLGGPPQGKSKASPHISIRTDKAWPLGQWRQSDVR
jgi:hypothetical protein